MALLYATGHIRLLQTLGRHGNRRFVSVERTETSAAEIFCTYAARNFRVEAPGLQMSAGPASRRSAGRSGLRPSGNRQEWRMIKPLRLGFSMDVGNA